MYTKDHPPRAQSQLTTATDVHPCPIHDLADNNIWSNSTLTHLNQ